MAVNYKKDSFAKKAMVKKIHGRRKRYIPIGSSRNRKPRMKTFSTETLAKEYAEKMKLKGYSVEKMKYGLGKKYKIIKSKD